MSDHQAVLVRMYDNFNARDIDGVLAVLADDVAWANGMDGGHEHGLAAVRAYWTRQWAQVAPTVTPVGFADVDADVDVDADAGAVLVTVQQVIRDLDDQPLQGHTHGLHDKLVGHLFHFTDGKVSRFDIRDLA